MYRPTVEKGAYMTHTTEFDKKRNDIMDCAERLFLYKGYELTSVNTILKEVGIAKGTFYYYFDSKEAVMDAVIARIVDEDVQFANDVLARDDINPFEKLLTSLFQKPKSKHQQDILEQLYKADNALMKQRALQKTIEYVCPIYAKMIDEGNHLTLFSSSYPLSDIQFLIAGIQSLYDLSNVEHSNIKVDMEAMLHHVFQILCINEAMIDRKQVYSLFRKNM